MTVSVCMGIYNGEKFIEKQLQTIYRQSRPADEVILCDDCSTDRTVDIVKKFISDYKLEETWRLYENTENKGYPGNFYYAMSLCTGDVVFLADQDDVWHGAKIEKMCNMFRLYQEAKVICCKFGLIDEAGNFIHSIMQPVRSKETGKVRKVSIESCLRKCEWPGMVLAYKRKWYDEKKEKVNSELAIPHDFLICAWAAEEETFYQMDEELACHRRHENNAGDEEHRIGRLLNKQRKLKEIEEYLLILSRFDIGQMLCTVKGKHALQQKISSMQDRRDALISKKISTVLKSAWKHHRLVRGATVICDILIVKR